MKNKQNKVNDILDVAADLLADYVKIRFSSILKKKISDEEARHMVANVGLHILNKHYEKEYEEKI